MVAESTDSVPRYRVQKPGVDEQCTNFMTWNALGGARAFRDAALS